MKTKRSFPHAALLVCCFIIICSARWSYGQHPDQPYWPTQSWRTGHPADHGLNERSLRQLVRKIEKGGKNRGIHSLLIVKDGYLVMEEYFHGSDEDIHTLQSVTKSITSTLVGAAIHHGFIQSLDQKVLSFFPEYDDIKHLDENKAAITLRHALTMQTGMAWYGESHLRPLNRYHGDRMKYVLDYKMDRSPGEKWYYNSGIAILLGGLLENAANMNTADFAYQYLFEPLGIYAREWYSYRNIPHTGGGLDLKPRDMARIGYLYLRDGIWENKRIVPENWVTEATRRHVPRARKLKGLPPFGYGYMWWLAPLDKNDTDTSKPAEIYMAWGYMGQFIFVIPKYDMVVVFTGGSTFPVGEFQPIHLLYDEILPSID
ncbi:serine hydrolase [candidate division KSB1 bacterium]|nr:serine hydrolase [candidate division KSB1 bacterium]NIR70449.1 serine hydrolase [candidate division KSB1 bacterium]NIS23179.1 serine hydrolase [candidate division KSB1 bacterium]NIT70039.1 serine hydrolase [candidate division KSB1 bacterium]NIU23676.1 serine hydrolase [candidate division KSB1 bacterium]